MSGSFIMSPEGTAMSDLPGQRPQNKKKFTHLHLHTSYSLLDGAIRIPDLMKHVKSLGMDSVAMTDHGNMFGTVEFYKAAMKEGVKPIIGCEFYVSPGSRKEKQHLEKLADGNNYHLILLAQNTRGYANLIHLASRSYTEGFYRKPRIDYELLSEHSEGLICLTACLGGEVQRKVLTGRQDEAARLAGKLQEMFGPDRFFLEIQNHGLPEEMQVARGNLEIARKNNIKIALTNDSHFLRKEDQAAQDILLRINQKKTIEDPLQFAFNQEFYVKSPEEMALLFPELPDAMENTARIAEMIDLSFQFGNPLLPRFDVPPGETLESYMKALALEGLKKRYVTLTPQIMERFEFEYMTIEKMDFAGYFLIVQDFINYAKKMKIPVGPGRGSAAGSIISYALGITDIDPLKYDLLFERFLNPDRKEMPDIDVDFCAVRREEVINYVQDKYGRDRVGQIITYGTMAAKACLKDVARVLNIPFDEANSISKKFPDVLNISIDEALKTSGDLREYSDKGDIQKKLFAVAKTLEGNSRHTGVHAAGVVIAPAPLEDIVPLATVASKTGEKNAERILVTQYDMTALSDVGLVKMDFLGLRNLTVLDNALQEIKKRHNLDIDLYTLPLDDAKTYKLLHKGDVKGVFQLESSSGMREFVIRLKPERFEDLIALIALFRPGPLQSGMAESYINRKKGTEKLEYPHRDLEEILKDTYGVIVYQEQVMLISRKIGGFTPGESDALRKAMGKKIKEKMAEMRIKFIAGARAKNYPEKFPEEIYDQMAKFAEYGFNKSHSTAYALIVYQTAYMKANYPTEYMKAVLDSEISKTEDLVPYINACREMGIKILGPDINLSDGTFKVMEDGVIRYGLYGIKNVGEQAVDSILETRKSQGPFKSFFHFMENADLRLCNRRMIESLIHAGCFNSLGYTRKALIESLEMAILHAQKSQEDKQSGQASLFGMIEESRDVSEPIPRGANVGEYAEADILRFEKDVLGFYFSGHPLEKYERILKSIKAVPVAALPSRASGSQVEIAGVVSEYSFRPTKTNREMCRLVIEDMTGSVAAIVFPTALEKIKHLLIKDAPLLFKGTLEKKEETGTPQILVDGAQELSRENLEEKLEKSLHLKLDSNTLSNIVVDQLQTILKCFSGPLKVYFHLQASEEKEDYRIIRAHDSFNVQLSQDMLARLRKIKEIRGIFLSVGDQYRNV